MSEEALPATKPAPEKVAPQVEVAGSPVRCPYCHTGCQPADEAAIVCQGCLSRHHGDCWREGGARCSSCGSTEALKRDTPEIKIEPAELELLRDGLSREAIERVQRRLSVSEVQATVALLEAASCKLRDAGRRLPPIVNLAIAAPLVLLLLLALAGSAGICALILRGL
ncbi:MAG: hypothetical protein KDD82_21110 [Planctomycetes bacterium]|nr:hypothetical protein [Planctomycetota bacterium]